jgi:2-hydroxymuconate-semialdehyde hydrolase
LHEFLDKLGLQQVIVVGHDIGGGIAQILATRYPQRVHRMVLINSVIQDNWPVLEMRMLSIPILGYAALSLFEKPLWSHVLRKGFSNEKMVTESLIERYQHWYQSSAGRHKLIRNAQALNSADLTSIADPIHELPIPTLILWGRNDRYLGANAAQHLCRSMQDCKFSFIDHAGHFVLDEQPLVTANAIEQFLASKK